MGDEFVVIKPALTV